MRIDILTACPELLESPLNHSIVQRAKDKGLVEIYVHNLRDFTLDKHRKIDDYAFGFGAGMVLQVEPIDRAISYLTSQRQYDEIIFTAPDGERFTQKEANTLSLKENIIILDFELFLGCAIGHNVNLVPAHRTEMLSQPFQLHLSYSEVIFLS